MKYLLLLVYTIGCIYPQIHGQGERCGLRTCPFGEVCNRETLIHRCEVRVGTPITCSRRGPCLNAGRFVVTPTSFFCDCRGGYTGKRCQNGGPSNGVRPCQPNPCRNSGTCTVRGRSAVCTCRRPWYGPTCESRRNNVVIGNPCRPNPCRRRNETCVRQGSSYVCRPRRFGCGGFGQPRCP